MNTSSFPRLILALALLVAARAATVAQKPELVVQTGHTQPIRSLAFSPDGRLLASVGNDNSVIIWEVRSSRQIKTLKGHQKALTAVAFSPNGKLLATVSHAEALITIWDIASARVLWSTETRTKLHSGEGGDRRHTIAFSPDGAHLAVGNSEDRASDAPPPPPPTPPPAPVFPTPAPDEPDGQYSKRRAEFLEQYKRQREEETRRRRQEELREHAIGIWRVSDGVKVAELLGHEGDVRLVAFGKDGKTLVSGGEDKTLRIWDVGSAKEVRSFGKLRGEIKHLALSNSGGMVACAVEGPYVGGVFESDEVRVWEMATGREMQTLKTGSESATVTFSPDERGLFYITKYRLDYWDIAAGAKTSSLVAFEGKWMTEAEAEAAWKASRRPVSAPVVAIHVTEHSTVFSADSSLLAISSESSIEVWDWGRKTLLSTMGSNVEAIRTVLLSPDGRALSLRSSLLGEVTLVNLSSGKTFERLADSSSQTAFSPDGKTLAVAGRSFGLGGGRPYSEARVTLFDVEDGKAIKSFDTGRVHGLVFSPSGKFIATMGEDDSIKLWDTGGGALLKTLPIPGFNSYSDRVLAFEPTEREVWYQAGGKLNTWSFDTGVRVIAERFASDGVAFSKSGEWVATRQRYTGMIVLFNLKTHAGETLERGSALAVERLLEVVPEYFLNDPEEAISLDGRLRVSLTADGRLRFRDLRKGTDLADMIRLRDSNWAVVAPDGRFDASRDALRLMHYANGLEVITLEQLKERYYEPWLLQKLLGFRKEP